MEQVATDFGVHPMTLWKWMRRADIDDGTKPGVPSQESAELRETRRRIKLLEQENEVLRRAALSVAGASAGKRIYLLVKELAVDGVPVTVTCRVLKLVRQPYYRWLGKPVADAVLAEAYRANALFDAHRDAPEFGYRFLADEACGARGRHGRAHRVADLPGKPLVECLREEAWPGQEGRLAGARRSREP